MLSAPSLVKEVSLCLSPQAAPPGNQLGHFGLRAATQSARRHGEITEKMIAGADQPGEENAPRRPESGLSVSKDGQ